ncbi:MAG: SoxR reducing system RseC family protein [Kosmotoga sp.]|nr:MAG: SoxR reducing system RseC family protein [Kosmotoga sp.]
MSNSYSHIAKVVEKQGKNFIKVEVVPMNACASCSIANSCCGGDELSNKKYFVLYNSVNAEMGDEVVISISAKSLFKSVMVVYVIPIILLLVVAGVSTAVFDKDIYTAIISLGFLVLYFVIIKILIGSGRSLDVKVVQKTVVSGKC